MNEGTPTSASHRQERVGVWGSDGLGGGVVDQALSVLHGGDGDGVDGHPLVLGRLFLSVAEAVEQDAQQDDDGYAQDGSYHYGTCEGKEDRVLKSGHFGWSFKDKHMR